MTRNNKLKGKPVDISVFFATEMEGDFSIPRFPKQKGSNAEHEREFTEDKGSNWKKQNMTETRKQIYHRSNSTENNTWRNLSNKITEGTSIDWKTPIQDGKGTYRSQTSAGTDEVHRDNLTEDTYTSWGRNINNKDGQYRRESSDNEGSSWRRKDMTETGKHLSDRSNSTENFNSRNIGKNLTEGTSTGWRDPIQDGKNTWRSKNSTSTDDVYRDNLTKDTNSSWGRNIHKNDVQYRTESTEDKGSRWRRKDTIETGKYLSNRSNSTESINRRNLSNNLTESTSTGWRNPIQDGKRKWSVGTDDAYRDNLTEDTNTSWRRKVHSKDAQYRRESTEGGKDVQYGRESTENKGGSWKREKEKGLSDGSNSAECNSLRTLGKIFTESTSTSWIDKNSSRGYNLSGKVLGSRESSSKDEDAKEMGKPEKDMQAYCKDPGCSIGNKSPGWGNGQNLVKSLTEDTTSNNQKSNSWSSFCKDFPIKKDTADKSNPGFSKDNHHGDKNHSTSESKKSSRKNVLEGNDMGEDYSNSLFTDKNMSKENKDRNNPIEGSKTNLTSGSLFPKDNPDGNKPKGDVQKINQDQSSSCVEPSMKNYTCVEDTITQKKDTATTTDKTNVSGNFQIRSADSLNQVISLKTDGWVSVQGKEHRNVIDHPKESNKTIKAELKPITLPEHKHTNISYNKNTTKNQRVSHYTYGGARDNWDVTEKYKGNELCRAAASKYLSVHQKAHNRFSLLQLEGD